VIGVKIRQIFAEGDMSCNKAGNFEDSTQCAMSRLYVFLLFCTYFQVSAQSDRETRNSSLIDRFSPKPVQWRFNGPLPEQAILSEPFSPLRAPAEWEEQQALVVSWAAHFPILAEIVRNARLECNVIICVADAAQEASARTYLTSRQVDLSSNVQFVIRRFNSIWVRDYGPNACYTNEIDSLVLVDWVYNRPRPQDDTLSYKIAEVLQVPIYATNSAPNEMIHTGGNFMSDGHGLGYSSKLVLDENGPSTTQLNLQQLEQIMQTYHGIERYALMEKLPYDGIHHIDMHMKLLNEETILVGQYPSGVSDGPQIEANLQYILANYTTAYGEPFKVVRIPMPPDGGKYPSTDGRYFTYSNAVFVNKTVLVPTYGAASDSTTIINDSIALGIWRQALPGYQIVGINCRAIIGSLGALHCITKEIGVSDPLWISYAQLPDVTDNPTSLTYPLNATIKHKSGIAAAWLHYRMDTSSLWNSLPMVQGVSQDEWLAQIPHLPDGSLVHYYVEAEANSGKKIAKPLPAPAGFYSFRILEVSSLVEAAQVADFQVFPNPANAITCVAFDLTQTTSVDLQLTDMLGRSVKTLHSGKLNAGEQKFFFQASSYPAGVYQLILATAHGRKALKVVVSGG
jgi:agmatine deiminase